jgi:hypothetical protein
MNLILHTRGSTTPKDKPQVLLISDKTDEALWKSLVDTLLSMEYGVNAAVWVSEPPQREDALEELDRMGLIVIAVTSKLLREPLTDFKRLIERTDDRAIPILPVFDDTDTAADFNKKISPLHGIMLKAVDFGKQMHEQLAQLVISDETVQDVLKNAFTAQLFLSYRKKDRVQALEIMRRVHALPACEALAIWFDDYLTAGRDFNLTIRKELDESDLFLLAVTPRMLEQGNYVIREEYPYAIREGKPVVPVQVEDTDQKGMSAVFKDIPPVVQIWDNDKFKESIISALGRKGTPAELKARQKYLLGMAYLSGIRVERNAQRAAGLLEEAVNEGEIDAALQLGLMYLARIGVKRDLKRAEYWKDRALTLCERISGTPGPGDLERAYEACFGSDGGLVTICRSTDRTAEAEVYCERFKKLYDLVDPGQRPATMLAVCILSQASPHFLKAGERTQERLEAYRSKVNEAINLLKKIEHSQEAVFRIAAAHVTLGELAHIQLRQEETDKEYRQAIEIIHELRNRSERVEYRALEAGAWNDLGVNCMRWMNLSSTNLIAFTGMRLKARDCFDHAIELSKLNYQESNTPDMIETYALALHNSVQVYKDADDVVDRARLAVKLETRLVEETEENQYSREILDRMRKDLKKLERIHKGGWKRKALIGLAVIAVLAAALYIVYRLDAWKSVGEFLILPLILFVVLIVIPSAMLLVVILKGRRKK